jgi:arylamine N-acetyltransferase
MFTIFVTGTYRDPEPYPTVAVIARALLFIVKIRRRIRWRRTFRLHQQASPAVCFLSSNLYSEHLGATLFAVWLRTKVHLLRHRPAGVEPRYHDDEDNPQY